MSRLRDDVTLERFLSRPEADDPLVRGKEELRAVWESQVEAVDIRLEPEDFVAAGDDKVIVPSVMLARGSGSELALSSPVTWVFSFDDHGLVAKVEHYESRDAALRAAAG